MAGAASGGAARRRAARSVAAIDAVTAAADAATAAAAAAVAAAAAMSADAEPLAPNVDDRNPASVSDVASVPGRRLAADAVSAGECFVGNQPESSAPSGWTVDGESVVGRGTVGVEEESASYTRSVVVDRRPDEAAAEPPAAEVPFVEGETVGLAVLAGGSSPVDRPEPSAVGEVEEVLCVCTDFFPESGDADVDKDRWMTVRSFVAAMLAEPVLNVFVGCDLVDVEVLARALISRASSSEWIQLAPCVTPVVFVWQFLLLVRSAMDAKPNLCQAVGELMLFCVVAEEETMVRWESKAKPVAKAYRDKWEVGDAATYREWLLSIGVQPPVTHVVAKGPSKARVLEQADELRTGQSWPGRPVLRGFPEDSTAEKQRAKAAGKREGKQADKDKDSNKDDKVKEVKAWDVDDCRHTFPDSVLRAPGVVTFVCGCGYIVGFELLRETESPAHVVAALVQRFKRFPRVVYFDTACQAQRNALRRVPWMMDGACTAWFIDRFHRCNHTCSPVFNADQYPNLSRGHDTSGAERQHSIKKRSKNSLSYMTQRRFIVRSRIIAAHNNIRTSQRREATKQANASRPAGEATTGVEIQHKPVETYYHHFIVSHCEMGDGCPCRGEVKRVGQSGLERKV